MRHRSEKVLERRDTSNILVKRFSPFNLERPLYRISPGARTQLTVFTRDSAKLKRVLSTGSAHTEQGFQCAIEHLPSTVANRVYTIAQVGPTGIEAYHVAHCRPWKVYEYLPSVSANIVTFCASERADIILLAQSLLESGRTHYRDLAKLAKRHRDAQSHPIGTEIRVKIGSDQMREFQPPVVLDAAMIREVPVVEIEQWAQSLVTRVATQVARKPEFRESFARGIIKDHRDSVDREQCQLVEAEMSETLQNVLPKTIQRSIKESLQTLCPKLMSAASLRPECKKPTNLDTAKKEHLEATQKMVKPLRDRLRSMRMVIALISADLEERMSGKVGGKVVGPYAKNGFGAQSEYHLRHLVQRSLPSTTSPSSADHAGFREACEYALELHHGGAVQIEGVSPVLWACIKMATTQNGERSLNFTSRIYQISPSTQLQLAEILLRGTGALTDVYHIEAVVAWIYQILTHVHQYTVVPKSGNFKQLISELLGWRQNYWQSLGPVGWRPYELLRQALQLYT